MAGYLLDTNHAASLVTLSHPLRHRVLDALEAGHSFSICSPSLAETLFGIGILPRAEQNLAEWARLRPHLPCYPVEELDAESAAKLQVSLRRRGWQLETIDALIAVTALRNGLILLTTDRDFEGIPGLSRENWIDD
jgi:tRNA(fMet)-specific endonuclease VapC